jgi:HD-like signal output (HDOD) protein
MLNRDELVRAAYRLEPLPPSLTRLAGLVASEEPPELQAILDVVSYDPILTGRLLQVANSAYNGGRRPIATTREALIRLGSGTILRLVVGSCAGHLLERAIPEYGLTRGELWQHSTLSALAAEAMSVFCKTPIPPASFTAALLHDLGKLIVATFLSPELRVALDQAIEQGGLERFEAETEILNIHHGEVGGIIAQHWKLPDGIVQGIVHHHTPEHGQDTICYATRLADAVANRVTGKWTAEDLDRGRLEDTKTRLGMTEQGFEGLCDAVGKCFGAVQEQFA